MGRKKKNIIPIVRRGLLVNTGIPCGQCDFKKWKIFYSEQEKALLRVVRCVHCNNIKAIKI